MQLQTHLNISALPKSFAKDKKDQMIVGFRAGFLSTNALRFGTRKIVKNRFE